MTPLTAADIARLYKTTIGYVYKLAHHHKWRRITHQGRTYYHLDDADKTLGR